MAHISLAAARADNFYNPPDWDPRTITRDKFQGSRGSNQYEIKGLIRFEMPWNIWCTSCNSHIGRGVRYNAKKNHVGHYFSTKLWEFEMHCHLCKSLIKIQTDPENADYKITHGAKRQYFNQNKNLSSDNNDNNDNGNNNNSSSSGNKLDDLKIRQLLNEADSSQSVLMGDEFSENVRNVLNESHKERMETDTLYRLENEELDKKKAMMEATRLERLSKLKEIDKNDYENNCKMRKLLRATFVE